MDRKSWTSGQLAGCALIRAASEGRVDKIAKLLDNGADVNFQRKTRSYEETALMAASKNNELDAVKLLLKRGADIGVQYTVERVERDDPDAPHSHLAGTEADKHPLFRGTALSFAAHWCNEDIVHHLLARGQLQKQNIKHALRMTKFECYKIDVADLTRYCPSDRYGCTEEAETMASILKYAIKNQKPRQRRRCRLVCRLMLVRHLKGEALRLDASVVDPWARGLCIFFVQNPGFPIKYLLTFFNPLVGCEPPLEAMVASARDAERAARKRRRQMEKLQYRSPSPVAAANSAACDPPLSRKAINTMKPKHLKTELKQRGLSTQGNKKTLKARLLGAVLV